MDNNDLKNYGPGFLNDLARMGGDVVANMDNDEVKASGPSSVADLARMGGTVIEPAEGG